MMDSKISKLILLLIVLFIDSASSGVTNTNVENEPGVENESNNGANKQDVKSNGNTGSFQINNKVSRIRTFPNIGGRTAMPVASRARNIVSQSSTNRFSNRQTFNVNHRPPSRFTPFRMPSRQVRPQRTNSPNTRRNRPNRRRIHLSSDVIAGGLSGSMSVLHKTKQTRPWSVTEALKFNVGKVPVKSTSNFNVASNQRTIKQNTTRYPIKRMNPGLLPPINVGLKPELLPPITIGTSFKSPSKERKPPVSVSSGTRQIQTQLFGTNTYPANREKQVVRAPSIKYPENPPPRVVPRVVPLVVERTTTISSNPNPTSINSNTLKSLKPLNLQTTTSTQFKDFTTSPFKNPSGSVISTRSTTPSILSVDIKYSSNKPLHSTSLTSQAPADYLSGSVAEVYNHNVATNIMKPNFVTSVKPIISSEGMNTIKPINPSTKAPTDKPMIGSNSVANLNQKEIKVSPVVTGTNEKVIVNDVNSVNNGLKKSDIGTKQLITQKTGQVNNVINPVKVVYKTNELKVNPLNDKTVLNIENKIQPMTGNTDKLNYKQQLKNDNKKSAVNDLNEKNLTKMHIGSSKDIWTAMDTRSPLIEPMKSFYETGSKRTGSDLSSSGKTSNLKSEKTAAEQNAKTSVVVTSTHSPEVFKVSNFTLQNWIKGDMSKMVLDVSNNPSKSTHVTKFWTPTKEYLRALKEIERRKRKRIMNQETLKKKLMKETINNLQISQKKQNNRISRAINTDIPISRVTTAWYQVPPVQPDVINDFPPQFQDIPPISLDSVIGPSSTNTNLGSKLSIKSSNNWDKLMGGSNMPTWDTGPTTTTSTNNNADSNATTASIDSIVGTRSFDVKASPPTGPNTLTTTADWNTGSNTATSTSTKWEVKSSKSSQTWSIGPNTGIRNQHQNAATTTLLPSTERWNQSPSSSNNANTNWSGQSSSSVHWSNTAGNAAIASNSQWTTHPPSNSGSSGNSQWNQNTELNSGINSASQWDNTNGNSGFQSSQWDQNSGTGAQNFNQNMNSNSNVQQGQNQWDQNTGSNTGGTSSNWNQNTGSTSQWDSGSNIVNQNTRSSSVVQSHSQWDQNTGSNAVGTTANWNQNSGSASQWNSGATLENQNTGNGIGFQSHAQWNQNTGSNTGGTSANWNQNTGSASQWNSGSNAANQNSGSSSGSQWGSGTGSSANFANTATNPSWNQNTGTGSSATVSGSSWNQQSNANTNWQQGTSQNSNSQWKSQPISSNMNTNMGATGQSTTSPWNSANTISNNGQWNQRSPAAPASSVGSINENQMASASHTNSGQSFYQQNQQQPSGSWNQNKVMPPNSGTSSNWNTGSNTGNSQWNSGGQWNSGNNNVRTTPTPIDNSNVNVIKQSGLLSGGVQTLSQGVVITKPEPPKPPPPPPPPPAPPAPPPAPPRQNQWQAQNWRGGAGNQGWHSAHQKGWVEIPQNNPPPAGGVNMRQQFNPQPPRGNNWNPGFNNQQPWQNNQWYPNNQQGNQQGPPLTTTTTTTTQKPTTTRRPTRRWKDHRSRWERMRERRYQMELRRRRVYQRRLNRQLAVGDVPEGISNAVQLNNFVNALGGRLNPQDAAMAVMIDLT